MHAPATRPSWDPMTQPFGRAHLPPVPDSWRVGGPDFVGVGYPKAGTSWWYKLLCAHPRIVANRLRAKELNYFAHFDFDGPSAQDLAVYGEGFAAPADHLCGEFSPGYIYRPMAIEWLHKAAPQTRVVVMIRNPIDRATSHMAHMLRHRAKRIRVHPQDRYIVTNHSLWPEAIYSGLLHQPFRRLLSVYAPEQVLILQYEACCRDPAGMLAATYRFLGIDDGFRPSSLRDRVNVSRDKHGLSDLPQREQLARFYWADVEGFLGVVEGLDLDLWPDFRAARSASL